MKRLVLLVSLFSLEMIGNYSLMTVAQTDIKSPSLKNPNETELLRENCSSAWIDVNAILLGVISSLIASGLFWYLLYRQKPIIEISPQIARLTENGSPMSHDGKPVYAIKIINKTHADIINIKFDLSVAQVIGQSTVADQSERPRMIPKIKLDNVRFGRTQTMNELMAIDRFNKNDSEAKYAQQLVFVENIEQKCNQDSSFLLFKIVATHAASGFSEVFEKRYDFPLSNGTIKIGSFEGGNSMEIR